MRFLIHLAVFFGVALALGFGLSFAALEYGGPLGTYRDGPWIAWPDVGVARPDPYTKAHVSRTKALELARAEGIRFTATRDSDGQPLLLECNYRIDGKMPESAFWTLAATDGSGALAVQEHARMALVSGRILQFEDGAFVLHAGPALSSGNWLETRGTGSLVLVLSLYDTTMFSGLGNSDNHLPSISREGCA